MYEMTVALMDGKKELQRFPVKVKIVKETLMETFNKRYTPKATAKPHLYGRVIISDKQVAEMIEGLKGNNWMMPGYERCYTERPEAFAKNAAKGDYVTSSTIEYQWEEVCKRIGWLGRAFALSKVYGNNGDPEKHAELRDVLLNTILKYMQAIPVNGWEFQIDGKNIGTGVGDGFSMFLSHRLAEQSRSTHQWTLTDPLVVPLLHLMPYVNEQAHKGDKWCINFQDQLVRFFQLFTAEIESRRAIDDPDNRWGNLSDTISSPGAWADANLGHRARTLLAIPIIWNDYNRPLTYVPYWYPSHYENPPFPGFSYSTGWTPKGIVADINYWMYKYQVPAHHYIQSGFQPDGSISHHTDNATDMTMIAYGFGWLTDGNPVFEYMKDTDFRLSDNPYQFEIDRLLHTYPTFFYRGSMDFLISGRSFDSDMHQFACKTFPRAVKSLKNAMSADTKVNGLPELKAICKAVKNDSFERSVCYPFWVNEFIVHRRGEHEKPFYASLKLKSWRTVGNEDFGKIRRSWYMGYGIMPLRVSGREYTHTVIANFDYHALPGLTEEWRTDAMPAGHAQASLPGDNNVAGVLADSINGMATYHHLPRETYSSATARKSYNFIGDRIVSQGRDIERLREGQGQPIMTYLDQAAMEGTLSFSLDGKAIETVDKGDAVNITRELSAPAWFHIGEKGYVVLPEKRTRVRILTGGYIHPTDSAAADGTPCYIIALDHGVLPSADADTENAYRYILLPGVDADEMPARMAEIIADMHFARDKEGHAVYSGRDKTWQFAFFEPSTLSVAGTFALADASAQLMLTDTGKTWRLTAQNPAPDGNGTLRRLSFSISQALTPGTYSYRIGGLYPRDGETVRVEPTSDGGSRIIVELPDARDNAIYDNRPGLYSAASITVNIPK